MEGYFFLAQESQILLYTARLGLEIGLAYDFFRMIRRVWKCGFFTIAGMDLVFWGIATWKTFSMLHTRSNGTLRWFAVLGVFITLVLYFKICSRYMVQIGTYILRPIKATVIFTKKCLTKCIKLPIIKIGVCIRKRRKNGKKNIISDELS